MNKEEVKHLAVLARIELTDSEIDSFASEMSSVLEYVSQIQNIVGTADESAKSIGDRYNVFRADEVTNQPEQYTDSLLKEMPRTEGRFMVVKKILNTDTE
ncbi:MAG TPA: Asp-tRNA(Asn)/Glu-tRNA(Gln) amidotransferase subunit GatC [Candidatus Paceibacterota bacterium]|nr:Asp-tRNA(Asn)/Glu-tRNA(Gln) amidotransferase subunit GatC [Candidatus Paceibacterota bacterium]HMO83206.1 Asp-tRNA(Asn)/Glu-tRNA(Gln) amidotransferase subunit GatC [Candidatus Paceibacterota bacterium]